MRATHWTGAVVLAGLFGCSGAGTTALSDAGIGRLEVSPSPLSFVAVPIGSTAIQSLTLTNVGTGALTLSVGAPVGAAGPLFAVQEVGIATTLPAGQSIPIEVSYAPLQISANDEAVLPISWDRAQSIDVPLTGSAVEAPCRYAVSSPSLEFGQVQLEHTETLVFSIDNLGPGDCTVSNLGFASGSSPAFSLPGGELGSQQLSPPGVGRPFPYSLRVSVSFFPVATGDYEGAAQFSIGGSLTTVQLSGAGALTRCLLVTPVELNFGVIGISNGQYCAKGKKSFVAVNGCDTDATVSSIEFVGNEGPFQFLSVPAVPFVVPPGQTSAPVIVGFSPQAAGSYQAGIRVESDAAAQAFGVGLTGSAVEGTTQSDNFRHTFTVGPTISYTFPLGDLGEGEVVEVTSVSVNEVVLSDLDWSYDPIANAVTLDSRYVTLNEGDFIEISVKIVYALTCN